MLVKLTPGVDFTNIIGSAFLPISFWQERANSHMVSSDKVHGKAPLKMFVKVTSFGNEVSFKVPFYATLAYCEQK